MPEFKKGNLICLITPLADLLYLVKEVEGDLLIAKKLDSPPKQWEKIPISNCLKLAEEQEKLLPSLMIQVIADQRQIVFAQPKKKKKSLDALLKGLGKGTLEEMFGVLSEAGLAEEREDE
jgi:hypothetical protein